MGKLTHKSFENTEVAFAYMTDEELKNAYRIFKFMNNPTLVKAGSKALLLALRLHLPVKPVVKKTIYRHFCGGETLQEVNEVVGRLDKFDINVILNYGVEGKHSEEEFDKTARALHKTLGYAIQSKNIDTISCKPSGLIDPVLLEKVTAGTPLTPEEKESFDRGKERIRTLVKKAYENRISVHLDAEETWIQGAIDTLAWQLSREFNRDFPTVINGVQLYLKNKLDFLKASMQDARKNNYIAAVKLVRGAYMEKERKRAEEMGYPSPICDTIEETHANYNAGLKFCVENIDVFHLSNATHNEDSCIYLTELMEQHGLPENHPRIVSSQLKGMSDNITFVMAKAGYNVQKYIPYGPVKQVIPYLLRRAQENTSVEGQSSRELRLIKKEMQRRGLLS